MKVMRVEIDFLQWPHPPHNARHGWRRLFYRLNEWLICSWRGHVRVEAEFCVYCERCRRGLLSQGIPVIWAPSDAAVKSACSTNDGGSEHG